MIRIKAVSGRLAVENAFPTLRQSQSRRMSESEPQLSMGRRIYVLQKSQTHGHESR